MVHSMTAFARSEQAGTHGTLSHRVASTLSGVNVSMTRVAVGLIFAGSSNRGV